ncbi:hypothetical protein C9374_008869 [Naegleria lovaniensis]|uniref:RGS domain-containing protein n=1 Tax=Naegleria lovaniensis TaxID=51637 RepID=A0AA88GEA6_NAELO|nr:uncharacterized protein C9374_008869 [Naegleria lovaniensis]KAG2377784.1 hypothetical protein C9374_008869 [Naegleria lovaniensis]
MCATTTTTQSHSHFDFPLKTSPHNDDVVVTPPRKPLRRALMDKDLDHHSNRTHIQDDDDADDNDEMNSSFCNFKSSEISFLSSTTSSLSTMMESSFCTTTTTTHSSSTTSMRTICTPKNNVTELLEPITMETPFATMTTILTSRGSESSCCPTISLSNIKPSMCSDHHDDTFEEDETLEFILVDSPCKQIMTQDSEISEQFRHVQQQRNYVADSNCLSPPMLKRKSQKIKDSEELILSKYGHQDRRATLTPISSAFLTQHQTQRNSLSKKGNFIHRLSIRKLNATHDVTLNDHHSMSPLMFLKNLVTIQKSNRTSPSSPSSVYHSNSPQISNNILHQMITSHGVSVYELSQTHDVVLIFLRSFTCPFTKYSISEMTKEYQRLINMNTLPVFVHPGSGFLEHEPLDRVIESKCEKKGLTRLWRSFYKSSSSSSGHNSSQQRLASSRDSLHTIFGANCVQSDQESFNLYKSIIEDYHRVSDPTGYLFFNHFNIRKLAMKSLINLSSLFSAITMTLQGYSVGICTNHLSQVHRLPIMFRVSKGEICEQYSFVDMQDKPDYIDFLVDANSEECVNLDYEFLSLSPQKPNATKSETTTPQPHNEISCVTIHPDKYIYSNNISSVPTDQLRDMNDNFEKNSSSNKLRKTFSCFFGSSSPSSSPRRRNNTGSSMEDLLYTARRPNLQILTSTDALKSARNEIQSSLSDILNDHKTRIEFKNFCETSLHLNTFCLYEKLKFYQTLFKSMDPKTQQHASTNNSQTPKCVALTVLRTFLNDESKAFVFSVQPQTIEKVKKIYERKEL